MVEAVLKIIDGETNLRTFTHFIQSLFPDQNIYARRLPLLQQIGLFAVLFIIFYGFAHVIPADGFFAFDWLHFFGVGNIPPFYPPWTGPVVSALNWSGLIGITLAAVAMATLMRAVHPVSLAMTFFSLPVLWTLFLGQIDGLALMKPQVAIWGLAAKRSSILAFLLTLLISFFIWGLWPLKLASVWTMHQGRFINDIAIGLAGLPIAAVLLWFSRGDMDMLMLAGTFTTPYLLPYSLIVVTPAIGRLTPKAAVLACLLSWLPFSANWLRPTGWWLGWLFIIWLWACLASMRYRPALEEWYAKLRNRSQAAISDPE